MKDYIKEKRLGEITIPIHKLREILELPADCDLVCVHVSDNDKLHEQFKLVVKAPYLSRCNIHNPLERITEEDIKERKEEFDYNERNRRQLIKISKPSEKYKNKEEPKKKGKPMPIEEFMEGDRDEK